MNWNAALIIVSLHISLSSVFFTRVALLCLCVFETWTVYLVFVIACCLLRPLPVCGVLFWIVLDITVLLVF